MQERVPKAGPVELPEAWPELARQALVTVLSLSWVCFTYVSGWAADSPIARLRLKGENARLAAKCVALQEELRIKDARMLRIDAKHRPHYAPEERLAILGLKAAQGLSAAQTATRFLIAATTIAEWMKLLESGGEQRLLRLRVPVNKFSDFVELVVQQLRATVPLMGRRKLAEVFARAGLHVSASTVRRLAKEPPRRSPPPAASKATEPSKVDEKSPKIVANRPGHVWNCDLTACAISSGFWIAWLPQAIQQSWPFAWWLLVVADHFSRKIVSVKIFAKQPTAVQVCEALSVAVSEYGAPRHLISDQGPQFTSAEYRAWCAAASVRPRWGAIGQHGSIALTERVILSLKQEWLWRILIPMSLPEMTRVVWSYVSWYNEHRPHRSLDGATPNEVFEGRPFARDAPRYEPRAHYPRGRPPLRGAPRAVRGLRGRQLALVVRHHEGQALLPIVELYPVARAA